MLEEEQIWEKNTRKKKLKKGFRTDRSASFEPNLKVNTKGRGKSGKKKRSGRGPAQKRTLGEGPKKKRRKKRPLSIGDLVWEGGRRGE